MPRRAKLSTGLRASVQLLLPVQFEVQELSGGFAAPESLRVGVVLLMSRRVVSLRR